MAALFRKNALLFVEPAAGCEYIFSVFCFLFLRRTRVSIHVVGQCSSQSPTPHLNQVLVRRATVYVRLCDSSRRGRTSCRRRKDAALLGNAP